MTHAYLQEAQLTPAAHAHRLVETVKALRDDLQAQGYGPEAVCYVLASALGRVVVSDDDKARLLAMVREMVGDVNPIIAPVEGGKKE